MAAASEDVARTERLVRTHHRIRSLTDEATRLSLADLPPSDYFDRFLKLALRVLAAPAGAVWARDAEGGFAPRVSAPSGPPRPAPGRVELRDRLFREAAEQAAPRCAYAPDATLLLAPVAV